MSLVEQTRQRHAEELRRAELEEERRSAQTTPEEDRAAIKEGVRIAREARESAVTAARPVVALSDDELRERLAVLEATIDRLENAPQMGGVALGNLGRSSAQARSDFDAQFDPTEFLEPVAGDRFVELAALWAAGSTEFFGAIRTRLLEAYPQRNLHVVDPELYDAYQGAIPLRSETLRRERESARKRTAKPKRRLRRLVSATAPGASLDGEDDAGFKGPVPQ